jgi:CheY-like chemotaxis protein
MKNLLLLAENDPKACKVWGIVLSQAGYDLRYASNSAEARDVLRRISVDLAILDLRLEDDDSEADISGLEVANEKAFRHIPKLILTAFETTYTNLRKVLGPSVNELPPAIAFVHKDEGPRAMLEVVEDALRSWPRLRMATLKVSERIATDYHAVKLEADLQYALAIAISIMGLMPVFGGTCLAWLSHVTIGVVGTTAGVILEAVGYLVFARLDVANARMDSYHGELAQTYWLELLPAAAELLPAEKQVACMEQAIETAVSTWLGGG